MINQLEFLNTLINNRLADLNTCIPAKIISYDFKTKKAVVQPAINLEYNDGEVIEMPKISNVPVMHPSTSKASIIFPISIGDNVTLIFSQKSLENWLKDGEISTTDDPRQFDLTDAIAMIGISPFSEEVVAESKDDLVISCNDSKITMKPSSLVKIKATTLEIESTNVNVSGKLTANNIEATSQIKSATASIGGKDFATHTHGGVMSGASMTGVVS
jgi:hypothetical protein